MPVTRIARVAIGIVLATATLASAQTRTFVKVVKNRSIIWRLSMPTPMITVNAETVLEVVGRDGEWYVVRLLERSSFSPEDTGRIAPSQVELLDPSTVAAQQAELRPAPQRPTDRVGQAGGARDGSAAPAPPAAAAPTSPAAAAPPPPAAAAPPPPAAAAPAPPAAAAPPPPAAAAPPPPAAAAPAPPAAAAPAAPDTAAAVVPPPGYVIGANDVLAVVFWREKDLSADVTVRPDGNISLPLLNDVPAAGRTPEELRSALVEAASRFVEDPNPTVVVKQINSRKVFVTGNVMKPGAYALLDSTTVLQLISMAGGLREFADDRNIVVIRTENGRQSSYLVNYHDVIRRRNLKQNILLKSGDTVVVP